MGKWSLAIWATLAATAAMPACAQDAPAAGKEKAKPIARPAGAASASYARCAPGNPIGGVIVKGAAPAQPIAAAEGDCPSTDSGDEHRTYTGGRRNEEAPSALVESDAGMPATSGEMPTRLSMTPTTAKKAVPPPQPGKSISEKGVK